jgi:hypothetical protein
MNEGTLIYHMGDSNNSIYEHEWLTEIVGKYTLKSLENLDIMVEDGSWFLVQRPHLDTFTKYFESLQEKGIKFKVLHLSDEFFADNISFYQFSNCKAVIRNYYRPDVPQLSHVKTVPLGFHYKGSNIKTFENRDLVWSFHGTNWFNRSDITDKLSHIKPNNCHFTEDWASPNMSVENDYLGALKNSKFCPILRGNNVETFRLYECLECGTIPLYVRNEGDDLFWSSIRDKLNLYELSDWDNAIEFIKKMLDNPLEAEKYRCSIYEKWQNWKKDIKDLCKELL